MVIGTNSTTEYILGTHDAELRRLGFQHRVWSREAAGLWDRAGFGPGQRIVDVGCGPGFASLDLAGLVGSAGRILSVDESPHFLDHLRTRSTAWGLGNVEVYQQDVQELSLPAGGADGAYARWVICFVENPDAVVAAVAGTLRPGGVFAVQDYLYYRALRLCPDGRMMEKVIAAVDASWRARKGDPDICRRLPTIMARHGFEIRDARPIVRCARPGSALWDWPGSFFRNYLPTLVANGYLTPADQADFEKEWAEHSANPNAVFCTPIVMDIIAVKK